MSARFKPYRPLRRKVAIRRDGEDFVIALQPEDIVVFRHAEATEEPVLLFDGKL